MKYFKLPAPGTCTWRLDPDGLVHYTFPTMRRWVRSRCRVADFLNPDGSLLEDVSETTDPFLA